MDIAKLDPKDYEEIVWSRPENNRQASRLVILGGSKDHFAITSKYYMSLSHTKGIKIKLILPNYLTKLVGNKDQNIIFVSSHKTGGYYTKESIDEVSQIIGNADLAVLAGEIGRNNETQQFIEAVVCDHTTQLVLNKSSLNCFADNYLVHLLSRGNTTLCIDSSDLISLGKSIKFDKAFTSTLGFTHKLAFLESFTIKYSCTLIISDENTIWVSKSGEVFYSNVPKSQDTIISDVSSWLSWNSKDPLKTIVSTFISS